MLLQARTAPTFIYNEQKPAADLFEAWLGAASEELDLRDVVCWLEIVFSETVFEGFDSRVALAMECEHERLLKRKVNGDPKSETGRKHAPTRQKL